jgi:hypothetical protein
MALVVAGSIPGMGRVDPMWHNYWVWCPGCNRPHRFIDSQLFPNDLFDGNFAAPTFSRQHYVNWTDTLGTHRCVASITAGVWDFGLLSTHALRNTQAAMVDVPQWIIDLVVTPA